MTATVTLARPVALDRGHVLRIRDGGGLTLRPESGVLWVTEEASNDDRVLAAGDAFRLESTGLALVYAHRASRVVIEAPRGFDRRPDVRIALHGADQSRPVPLWRERPARLVRTLVAAWRRFVRARGHARFAPAAVGGHEEHDLHYTSRRRRGLARRFEIDPRDPLYRAHLSHF